MFLILVFLLNTGEYYLWFLFVQNKVRSEMSREIKSGLKDEEMSLIMVDNNSNSEIHWIRQNKEFLYKWEMYDVVRIKHQSQKLYIYCVNDKQEKQLLDNYAVNEKIKKELDKKIKRFFLSNYFSGNYVFKLNLASCDCSFTSINHQREYNFKTIPSPPPKILRTLQNPL
jgi:hypothetical protein